MEQSIKSLIAKHGDIIVDARDPRKFDVVLKGASTPHEASEAFLRLNSALLAAKVTGLTFLGGPKLKKLGESKSYRVPVIDSNIELDVAKLAKPPKSSSDEEGPKPSKGDMLLAVSALTSLLMADYAKLSGKKGFDPDSRVWEYERYFSKVAKTVVLPQHEGKTWEQVFGMPEWTAFNEGTIRAQISALDAAGKSSKELRLRLEFGNLREVLSKGIETFNQAGRRESRFGATIARATEEIAVADEDLLERKKINEARARGEMILDVPEDDDDTDLEGDDD